MQMPRDIGPFHIIGIGGIGMSAIAEILVAKGYTVQGSDQKESANVRRLRSKGIRVFVGHDPVNLIGARYVVISTAVKPFNPELIAARQKGLTIIRRAEMLAELMRLYSTISVTGTHGKTTTTSLLSHIFTEAGEEPTVITGGIINSWGSNARLGQGKWMIVEADESDGTFTRLPTEIGIVTNIDPEHLDYFGSVEAMHREYEAFLKNIPFFGLAVACIDHPVVREMIERLNLRADGRRLLTYGQSKDADLVLQSIRIEGNTTYFDATLTALVKGGARKLTDWSVPIPGTHNALNALAAIAVATQAGLEDAKIKAAMAGFSGVKRRFQFTGEWNGVGIYDDYGHHPAEIAAVLAAARGGAKGKVIAVVEPHRFTRVRDLFEDFARCFKDADHVIVAPLYTAGEPPIAGVDNQALAVRIATAGRRSAEAVDEPGAIAPAIKRIAGPGDIVVCLGAGNSTDWAHALPEWLSGVARQAGSGLMFDDITSDLRALMPELRGRLVANAPLSDITWFRVGGPAQVLFTPADEADLAYFLKRKPRDLSVFVMGLGSNLLVRDGGVAGVVIRLGRGFGEIKIEEGGRLRTGTAVPDVKVARAAAEAGISGLAFYRGIPGSIGGALRMNAGAHGRETKDCLVGVRAVDPDGNIHVLTLDDMGFTYRHSAIPETWIFTEATYQGAPGDPAEILKQMDEVAEYREKNQPIKERTGGSTFKNPPGHSAWKLVDDAGCRGLRVGGAKVSEMHCNFLINDRQASGEDVERLGETVRARVKAKSGVTLNWEIIRLGSPRPGAAVGEALAILDNTVDQAQS